MFYFEMEDLKPHLLVLTPIITTFFITYIKDAKGKNLVKKFSLFTNRFPRIIISYVLCGIVVALLTGIIFIVVPLSEIIFGYYIISDSTLDLIGEIILIILGIISSYITMIHYD